MICKWTANGVISKNGTEKIGTKEYKEGIAGAQGEARSFVDEIVEDAQRTNVGRSVGRKYHELRLADDPG